MDRAQRRWFRVSFVHIGVLIGTLTVPFFSGCTDADIQLLMPGDSPLSRVRVESTVCAPPDLIEPVPYKVLFVIDTSKSNEITDPPSPPDNKTRRERAVRQAVESHQDQSNVTFGIITFSDIANVATRPTYTRDMSILNSAMTYITTSVTQYQGGTNYGAAIDAVTTYILNDIQQWSDPTTVARTHYIVYWLSDGFPTVGPRDPVLLLPGIQGLLDGLKDQVAEFQFNTAFLGSGDLPVEDQSAAVYLLRDMAVAGNGVFTNILDGEAFAFEFNPEPAHRPFTLLSAVACNMSAHYGDDHPMIDSDGDFLVDERELMLGLDPYNQDTDGDGLRDGVEIANPGFVNPLEYDTLCEDNGDDTDGDGLIDCEENLTGTALGNPHTYGDGILDGIAFFMGTAPRQIEYSADRDMDGYSDEFEVRSHLEPLAATTPENVDRWAYRYAINEVAGQAGENPSRCYEVVVDNVAMYQTGAEELTRRGLNNVFLAVSFAPDHASGPLRFATTTVIGRFVLPDYREPADGVLRAQSEDFDLLSE
ncbi:MAG: hypothetical protein A2289_23805 [Deltaproteobacteria bacterium RIFOXYA12_FULL_58_15]|nr:MAG: hypothetical protein A2289_23805 [Deltaproteobacteria bacterium RIFOXYA12_FULL_58_15]OGR07776.1 MAG: hypothetical protein A2341_22400 [Deltaproteobacteria bacterium RIFOXYB12_FULL_58_9]